jgi:hypothetical protein
MSVAADILALWRRPRETFRAKLAEGPREDRALAVLMGASALYFIAQWPQHARAAHLDPSVPLDARIGGALMGAVFLLPLVAYGVAALSHLVARAGGGRGTHAGARLALFWAMLATAPAMLLYGAVAGLSGPGALAATIGLGVFLAFLWLWITLLRTAEAGDGAWT